MGAAFDQQRSELRHRMSFDLTPKESNLESYLRNEAASYGWKVVKCGFDGWPDDIVVADYGVVGWIELKRRNKEPTPRQALRIEELVLMGQLAVWAQKRAQVDLFLVRMHERVQEARTAAVVKASQLARRR